jgi:hypothetical protein
MDDIYQCTECGKTYSVLPLVCEVCGSSDVRKVVSASGSASTRFTRPALVAEPVSHFVPPSEPVSRMRPPPPSDRRSFKGEAWEGVKEFFEGFTFGLWKAK